MNIRIYIDPNGEVTITTLAAPLVPIAYALDNTNERLKVLTSLLSQTKQTEKKEIEDGPMATPPHVEY